MRNDEHARGRKRLHLNNDSYSQINQINPYNPQKLSFIFDQKLANEKILKKELHKYQIGNQTIYFPHNPLYESQKKFMEKMFECLEKKTNLLIESPTGTGKTLNLLVCALQWAESYYQNSKEGVFDNQTKIIYTSRSHSQLDQISNQLEKTPYRPKMLIFGSRQKLCINEELYSSLDEKDYQNWTKKCSMAVHQQQKYLKNQVQIDKEIASNQKTIKDLQSRPSLFLSQTQKEQLQAAKQFLNDFNLRCTHYQNYDMGLDAAFNRHVGRKILNNEVLKKEARLFKLHSICPYYYPKRVKNRGTLYLMPYNYILDANILKYSTKFLQDSIIIFDQGHNTLKTACEGYSVKLQSQMLQSALRNINNKLNDKDFDADQLEKENLIKHAQNQSQQAEDNESMDDFLNEIKNREKKQQDQKYNQNKPLNKQESEKDKQKGSEEIKNDEIEIIGIAIKDCLRNFDNFFKFERTEDEFKRSDSSFSLPTQNKNESSQKKNFYWQQVRQMFTFEKQKMENSIEKILFSQMPLYLEYKPLKQKISFIIKGLDKLITSLMKNGERFFKLMNLATFFERLYNVLYTQMYENKFFLEVNQLKKYQQKLRYSIFKGEIKLQCLAPDFSFKLLQSIKPWSIIITSGTLSPMNAFGTETGLLKLQYEQVDPVIKDENVLVRKITKDLNGESLKINSNFYCGQNGLNIQNLTNLFNLLIKTIENIPHGVLVIVSSKSCLQYLNKFYNQCKPIQQRLHQVKQHVYFELKRNLDSTMKNYVNNSQIGKGALLFCVCRGKLSQGIDFKNRLCRSVIFFGIPYVNKGDSFVVSKGRYLKKMNSPFANEWKFIEASKAINQGLGRVVRNKNDFGSILLFDDRYHNTNRDSVPVVANISKWIKKNWQVCDDHSVLQKELSQFYVRCQQNSRYQSPQRYEN